MRRFLILGLFFLMSGLVGNCSTTFFPPLLPVNQNEAAEQYENSITTVPDTFAKPQNTNYSDISQIEQTLFGQTYENQNISSRLSRIEKSLFSRTYQGASNAQRIDNIISNFNQINKYPNISKNELSRLESRIFNQSFSSNDPQRRIERLEQQVFGAVQNGDLDSRYEAIRMASKTYLRNNNFNNYPQNLRQTGWKGVTNNLGNAILGGSMTGFTPPINPYNYGYNNSYNNYTNPYGSYGNYRGYRANRGLGGFGYNDLFGGFTNGTGVTILD